MPLERLIPYLALSIKLSRERLGLSFEELADKTGYSTEYLKFIESGGTIFSIKTLSTIADGLSMVPSELIEEAEKMLERDGPLD